MKKQKNGTIQEVEEIRAVEKHFSYMDEKFSNGNKVIYAVLLFIAFFAVMGLIWMIPFPQFDFLIRMNAHTFLNWGSFFIAIVIYLYLRLAPTLSYAILFCISIMSFFIVQLEYVERDGGPTVILVCSILVVFSLLPLYLYTKKANNNTIADFIKLLTIGPIWLWSKVFKNFKIKY